MTVDIEPSWRKILACEFEQEYFLRLTKKVRAEYLNSVIYPPESLIFNAFLHCQFNQVKVVILGQDPYHRQAQAMGLAFSAPNKVKIPPSLLNIYKEIQNDLDINIPESGNLERWADQGVLLLNSTLTVREGEPGSHQKLGWEEFTDSVIKTISRKKEHVVFILWGNSARSKRNLVDESKHLVLTAAHPSPLSAYRGFFGCQHFSQTNKYLTRHNLKPINW